LSRSLRCRCRSFRRSPSTTARWPTWSPRRSSNRPKVNSPAVEFRRQRRQRRRKLRVKNIQRTFFFYFIFFFLLFLLLVGRRRLAGAGGSRTYDGNQIRESEPEKMAPSAASGWRRHVAQISPTSAVTTTTTTTTTLSHVNVLSHNN